jgi:hypothetical protein
VAADSQYFTSTVFIRPEQKGGAQNSLAKSAELILPPEHLYLATVGSRMGKLRSIYDPFRSLLRRSEFRSSPSGGLPHMTANPSRPWQRRDEIEEAVATGLSKDGYCRL